MCHYGVSYIEFKVVVFNANRSLVQFSNLLIFGLHEILGVFFEKNFLKTANENENFLMLHILHFPYKLLFTVKCVLTINKLLSGCFLKV